LRPDLQLVAGMVPTGSRVLDLGCGDGDLLEYLIRARDCDGHGVEISLEGFHACIDRGVPVMQADIDDGLGDFDDDSFDVVVLSQTLQATRKPDMVLREMTRIGRQVIISFPNFGHWSVRVQLGVFGRMPVSKALPYQWYDTPNIHFCTIKDFERLAAAEELHVLRKVPLNGGGNAATGMKLRRPNVLALGAVYLLESVHA
jgi:methionine biosynthesis protein MetW